MQIGDKVVCIETDIYKNITKGKIYLCLFVMDIVDVNDTSIMIVDDVNRYSYYHMTNFMILSDYRNELIDKICK